MRPDLNCSRPHGGGSWGNSAGHRGGGWGAFSVICCFRINIQQTVFLSSVFFYSRAFLSQQQHFCRVIHHGNCLFICASSPVVQREEGREKGRGAWPGPADGETEPRSGSGSGPSLSPQILLSGPCGDFPFTKFMLLHMLVDSAQCSFNQ